MREYAGRMAPVARLSRRNAELSLTHQALKKAAGNQPKQPLSEVLRGMCFAIAAD